MHTYRITTQRQVTADDGNGREWTASHGLPTFEVVASSRSEAELKACDIVGVPFEPPNTFSFDVQEV